MTDRIRSPKDVPFRPAGVGLSQTFLCAMCSKPRLSHGRRLLRVRGLKTWVCAECAKAGQ